MPGEGPGTPAAGGLTPGRARRFYDRLGRAQDLQAFYEDRAVHDLIGHSGLATAGSVFEIGCGTGRLAGGLLARWLPPGARYLGADISVTMTGLASARLRPYRDRAAVVRADGTRPLPVADGCVDRFVAVYVLDLLSPAAAEQAVAEARRMLRPGGLLCAVSLAPGATAPARLVSRAWTAAWSRAPGLTGGCRPVTLAPLLDGWQIQHRALVTAFALTSEVVTASP